MVADNFIILLSATIATLRSRGLLFVAAPFGCGAEKRSVCGSRRQFVCQGVERIVAIRNKYLV